MNDLAGTNKSFRYENGKTTVSGVTNVISFDEKEVVLRLHDCLLTIKGCGFKMEEMEVKSGLFTMNGNIASMVYHEKAEKTSFFNKIFK
ncbi:MAG: YabP/YqfC family sporulation protein [Christensenellales bacterium]